MPYALQHRAHSDHALLQSRLCGSAAELYQTRDETPTLEEVKTTLDGLAGSVAQMQIKNDERLAEIERRGAADPLTVESLGKLMGEVDTFKEVRDKLDEMAKRVGRFNRRAEASQEGGTEAQNEQRNAFRRYIRNRKSADARAAMDRAQAAWEAEKTEILQREGLEPDQIRAALVGTPAAGGYAVPELIATQIQRELAEISSLRGLVHVINVGSPDYTELVDVGGSTFSWGDEGDTLTETNTPSLEPVQPTFGKLWAYPQASEEALNDVFFNVDSWLVDSVIEAFARGEESAIITGNGTKKPTGILAGTPTDEADGTRTFGVLQYVPSGLAGGFAADPDGADALLQTVYTLKKGYRANARWLGNKATMGTVRLLKNSDGAYLWQPSIQLGQPDSLFGYPVAESEEMPDVAANAFPLAFGDFNAGYLLADLVGLRVTTDEITKPGFVKWHIRRRMGGKVRKSEAIKLLKIAAS